ncbi:MAG: gliding motility-associated-like protein [Patiriisocius sp.]|jgi:gliding motility-associated-like protein
MKGRIVATIFLIFFSVNLSSQDELAPILECVEHLPNNNIRLKWSQPDYVNIQNNFPGCPTVEYKVFRANALDGAFGDIGTITHDQDVTSPPVFFEDTDAQADQVKRYYYIELRYFGSCDIVNSNIVGSMFLTLAGGPTTIQNTVDLSWNSENLTFGPEINIEENVNNTGWVTVYSDDITADSYSRKNEHCSYPDPSIPISYRLRIDSPNCLDPIYSNVENGLFKDNLAPELPFIQTVSVDCFSGRTAIYWDSSTSNDVDGYHIQNEGFGTVQTLSDGNLNLVLINSPFATDPELGPAAYMVVPFDDCLQANGTPNTTGADINELTSTIWLQGGYVECERKIELNWTPYTGWDAGVQQYLVKRILDDGTVQILESLPSSITSYDVENVEENVIYNLVVTATPVDDQLIEFDSWSNKYSAFTDYHEVAQIYDIELVTVVSESETRINFSVDEAVTGQSYRLEKLDNFGDTFESLITVSQDLAIDGIIIYSDYDVNNDLKGDDYRLVAIDKCENDVGISEVSNSIHLEVFANDGDIENILTWNEYQKWDFGVGYHKVYFSSSEQMPFEVKYNIFDPQETFKLDNVSELLQSESKFCYRVDALSGDGGSKISQSNIKCVTQSPLFYLPNAMVLNGQNRVWKPEGGFIDFESYELAIYDRWGTLLFQTKDFFEGWDGRYGGKQVREGVYAYFIKYREGDGKEQYRSGALTVLQAY